MRQVMLGAVRAFETMRRAPPMGDGYYRMPYLDPVTATAYYDNYNIDTRGSTREPWRTKYRHMLSIELFLLDLWDRTSGEDLPVEWFERLFARDNDFARVHIAPDYPITTAKLITDEPASVILADRLRQYHLDLEGVQWGRAVTASRMELCDCVESEQRVGQPSRATLERSARGRGSLSLLFTTSSLLSRSSMLLPHERPSTLIQLSWEPSYPAKPLCARDDARASW